MLKMKPFSGKRIDTCEERENKETKNVGKEEGRESHEKMKPSFNRINAIKTRNQQQYHVAKQGDHNQVVAPRTPIWFTLKLRLK